MRPPHPPCTRPQGRDWAVVCWPAMAVRLEPDARVCGHVCGIGGTRMYLGGKPGHQRGGGSPVGSSLEVLLKTGTCRRPRSSESDARRGRSEWVDSAGSLLPVFSHVVLQGARVQPQNSTALAGLPSWPTLQVRKAVPVCWPLTAVGTSTPYQGPPSVLQVPAGRELLQLPHALPGISPWARAHPLLAGRPAITIT